MSDLLKKRREIELASSRKVALSLKDSKRPHIEEKDILSNKLDARFSKVVARMVESIELNLPLVLTNPDKIKELHELRKYCKQLRYLLELIPHGNDKEVNSKEIARVVAELEDIQDILGSIHDSDIIITYLKKVRHKNGVSHILENEIVERNKKYDDFVQSCKRNLSDRRDNFVKLIAVMG